MKNFLKKNAVLVVVLLLVVMFVCFSIVIKKNEKPVKLGEEVNKWYTATMEGEKPVVTVLGQSWCGHCANYKPIITKVQENYGFDLFWFDLDTLTTKDKNSVQNTYSLTDFGGTPYTFIVNNGEVVATYSNGTMQEEQLITFLKENGVINE